MIDFQKKLQRIHAGKLFLKMASLVVVSVSIGLAGYSLFTHTTKASQEVWASGTMTSIQSINSRTCGIDSGKAYCWGVRLMPNGGFAYDTNPVQIGSNGVLAGKNIVSIAMSSGATCVLTSDDGVYCWGNNNEGALGDGTNESRTTLGLIDMSGALSGKHITSLQATLYGTFFVIADNEVYSWGYNGYAIVGDGSTESQNVPTPVDTSGVLAGKLVSKLTVTYSQVCALTTDNSLACWGQNSSRQLGNNSSDGYSTVPVAVDQTGALAGKVISSVSINTNEACVVASGDAYCWGYLAAEQSGTGTYAEGDGYVPVSLSSNGALDGKTVADIQLTESGGCVLTTDGAVYCFGDNSYGVNGDGTSNPSYRPHPIDTSGALAGKQITTIYKGSNAIYALAEGQLYGWGKNYIGSLGVGSPDDSIYSPQAIGVNTNMNGKAVSYIAPGEGSNSTCAIAEGVPYCWGNNTYGQLGSGTTGIENAPVQLKLATPQVVALMNGQALLDGQQHEEVIYGSDFQNESTVTFGSVPAEILSQSDGSITVKVPQIDATTTTVVDVTVTNSMGVSSTLHDGFTYYDGSLPITISSVNLSEIDATADGPSQTVLVYGSNFVDGAQVSFGSRNLATTFISSNELSVVVTNPQLSEEQTADQVVDIKVVNPDGHSIIAPSAFTYLRYVPQLGSISVSHDIVADGQDHTIAIYGKYFDGATVTTNIVGATYTIENATTINITLPTAGLIQTTSVDVTITNARNLTATFSDIVSLIKKAPIGIDSVHFDTNSAQKKLIVTGHSFPNYSDALTTSLVTLNGTHLPFCTVNTGGNAALFIQVYGLSPSLLSDTPTCYLLISAVGAPALTDTQAAIYLSDDFDITAPGNVSVGASPSFAFNVPSQVDIPTTSPVTTTTPPNSATPPSTAKLPTPPSVVMPLAEKSDTEATSTTIPAPVVSIEGSGMAIANNPTLSNKPTFTGNAPAGSKVTITVHSDPIVCSTVANSDGRWSCTLDKEIPAGNHTVAIAVVSLAGATAELGPYDFTVGSAKNVAQVAPTESGKASSPGVWWGIAAASGVVVIIIIRIITGHKRVKNV